MSDLDIGNLKDCYVTLENNKRAIAVSDGGVPVPTSEVSATTKIIDLYFFQEKDTFSLSSGVAVENIQFNAVGGHSIVIGEVVSFQEGNNFMQAVVLNVAANLITIDTPFDYAYTTLAIGRNGTKNINVDGSSTTQIFRVGPKDLINGVIWDIIRVIFSITDSSAMDDGKFGGLTALTNGIVLRKITSVVENIFNVKTNGQFALRAFDADYIPNTLGPSGQYGFRVRRTFGGIGKNGTIVSLASENNDEVQILVQDDLTGLDSFEIVVQGRVRG